MTITIQLADRRLDALKSQADRQGVSVEEYVQALVERIADTPDDDFRAAMQASFRENDELYRRLAK